jgi:hypothetical protein
MLSEGFAIGVANKRGTIDNFGGTLRRRDEILHFRKEGEPTPKGVLVGWIVEPHEVGRAQNQDDTDNRDGSGHFFRVGAGRDN